MVLAMKSPCRPAACGLVRAPTNLGRDVRPARRRRFRTPPERSMETPARKALSGSNAGGTAKAAAVDGLPTARGVLRLREYIGISPPRKRETRIDQGLPPG